MFTQKRKASNTENNASPAKHAPAVEENTTLVTQENENEEKCDEVKVAVANMEVTPNSTPTPKTSPSKPSVNSLPKVEPPVVASLEKTEKESPLASHSKEACTTTTETKSDPPPPKGKSDPLPPKVKSEPVPSETSHGSTKAGAKAGSKADATDDADDGAWETVELKTRGRKAKCNNTQTSNKPTSQNNRGGNNNQNHNNNSGRHDSGAASTTCDGGNSHSSRRHRRGKGGKDRRRREQRVVKDVISHILDAVDEEVARRRKQGTKSSSDEKRRSNNEKRPSSSNGKQHGQNEQRRKANAGNSSSPSKPLKSLRDVVAGSTAAPTKTVAKAQDKSAASTSTNEAQKKTKGGSEPTKGAKIKPGLSYKSVIEPVDQTSKPKPSVSSTLNGTKVAGNKAKPIPESNAIVAPTSKVEPTDNSEKPAQASLIPDNNSNSMEEKRRTSVSVTEDEATSPPLSTLLGPNSCSASSSVASSLEAPHSSRFRHQTATEDDVGFHLLNVCGQLSEEINTFMSRRSVALDIRRRERGAVLSALQDTLGVSVAAAEIMTQQLCSELNLFALLMQFTHILQHPFYFRKFGLAAAKLKCMAVVRHSLIYRHQIWTS